MDDKHFDEAFRDIMNDPPEFEVDAQALADLQRRLDEAERRKRRGVGWPWWIAPLLALPFLLTSLFFYFKFQQSQHQLNDQTLQLTQQIDTIINKYVVYHFDTIHTRVYKEERIGADFSSPMKISSPDFTLSFPRFFMEESTFWQSDEGISGWRQSAFEHPLQEWRSSGTGGTTPDLDQQIPVDWTNLAGIDGLPLKYLRLPGKYWHKNVESDWPKPDSAQIKRKVNPVYYFIPSGFRLGAHGSPVNMISLPSGKNVNGVGYGLAGELRFGKHLGMRLGIDILTTNFELKNQADFGFFPQIDPENPNDALKELKGNLGYLQIPLSMQYYFRSEKALRPYIDLGMMARKPVRQSFRYEFIGSGGEYYLSGSFTDSYFSIQNIRTALGMEYHFGKNIYGNLEGFYHYNFQKPEDAFFTWRYWGLEVGLKYGF